MVEDEEAERDDPKPIKGVDAGIHIDSSVSHLTKHTILAGRLQLFAVRAKEVISYGEIGTLFCLVSFPMSSPTGRILPTKPLCWKRRSTETKR